MKDNEMVDLKPASPSPRLGFDLNNGVGIDRMSFAVPSGVLDLATLAEARGVDPAKFAKGLGQLEMAVPSPDEDVVSLAAQAGQQVLEGEDTSVIDMVIFATESGIDQSKAGAIYVHGLLGLPTGCRAFEVKQACCSSTAALQMAMSNVALRPDKKVLVIATDQARYGLSTPGEPTQGAGALAMLVAANPRLLAVDLEFGSYTRDVMDFWRPNYRDEALVDGKYSIKIYLDALVHAFDEYRERRGAQLEYFDRFCYHLPFTRMGAKAHQHLYKHVGQSLAAGDLERELETSLVYNRRIGNTYTASLHIAILSMLENDPEDLAGKRVGIFSYGSGCMGTFLSAEVVPGYQSALRREAHQKQLDERRTLSLEEYERWYNHRLPVDGTEYKTPHVSTLDFRLAGINRHQRLYERVAPTIPDEAPLVAELATV